ncbi:MAG: hypothetical protein RL154_374, partial [Pseudomonadota bacterium]
MMRFLPLFLAAWLFADGHILLYHRVGETKASGISMNVTTAKLRQDLQYLKDNGYKVIPLSEMVAKVKSGQPIDDKFITITADDAYKSFYTNGVPILKEFGYPYALMVYVEGVNSKWPDYMNWTEVNDIVKSGNEIGLHSFAHKNMAELPLDKARADTLQGGEIFKEKTGQVAKYYAYPFGAYNLTVQNDIAKTGVSAILTTDSGGIAPYTNLMAMPRTALNTSSDLKFILKMRTLNVKITETNEPNGMTKISGEVLDSNISKLNVYIGSNN